MCKVLKLEKPTGVRRVETGPVQFGDDWPGVFLRGDNALGYTMYLRNAITALELTDPIAATCLKGLANELSQCNVSNIGNQEKNNGIKS